MKPFRLAGLLRLRSMQEEQAAADLSLENAARARAAKRRAEAQSEYAGTTLPHNGDVAAWHIAIAGRAALAGRVVEAIAVLDTAEERVTAATAHWSDARRRAVTLEKLADRHAVEAEAADLAADQVVLDELATQRSPRAAAPGAEQVVPGTPTATATISSTPTIATSSAAATRAADTTTTGEAR